MRLAPSAAAGALALLLPCAPLDAQGDEQLRFCIADHNLPMSTASPVSGVDVDVARALAAGLGVVPRFEPIHAHERADELVARGACDLAFGAVVEPGLADARVPEGLTLTRPYYSAGYLLVRRRDAPPIRSLSELGDARVGVEMESVAIFTLKQRGRRVYALDDSDAVLRAVTTGRIRYGYLWGPIAEQLIRDRNDVLVVREFEPLDQWDFALLGRGGEPELLARVDHALGALLESGEAARIFARHGIQFRPPSVTRSSQAGDSRR